MFNNKNESFILEAQTMNNKNSDIELNNFLNANAEIFSYTNLQKLINLSDYAGEFLLKPNIKARIVIKSGIINIVVKDANGEVFNGIWSNLSYDKIIEKSSALFEQYNK